ncbi:UvrD-helicase domain-containing protein [Paenibacillus protaetiae]|uniref:DNA 3'-5' helicase n=1 Tax=Paenibacillus protaetiae TaxID=2509456 RepID=A0A4P6EUM0_9BACL|nr:UvrD-helicase domain-containing protein [Paenibacillus protaetiae]QAY66366.1 hypothetical protein ET464_08045 [Paenibacillus protaetiae]
MNVISYLSGLIYKPRARKLIQRTKMYLESFQHSNRTASQLLDAFNDGSIFVSAKQYQSLVERYASYRSYFEAGTPFIFNGKAKSEFNKLSKWIYRDSEFSAILEYYARVQQESNIVRRRASEQLQTINLHNQKYDNRVLQAQVELEQIKQHYISHSVKTRIQGEYREVYGFFKDAQNDELTEPQNAFKAIFDTWDNQVTFWNQDYIQRSLEEHKAFFDDIDGKSLDEQQRVAVLTDEDNNLVLAGAGSGKTLTIAGKVKFLTQIKNVRPEEILLISFTNKAAGEMKERISERLHVNVDVKTFHKLGNEIIARHSNAKRGIVEELRPYVQAFFEAEILTKPALMQKIVSFFGVYLNIPRDRADFKTLGEYHESQKGLDFESLKSKLNRMNSIHQTLKGETMKSLEEILIANFLFLNGVDYEYEKDYGYPTATREFRQYKPDFYLPEYGLYIEHFGVNEKMRAPWLEGIEEEKYISGIRWKRSIHAEKKTTCIESFSYYNQNGVLLSKLSENLLKQGIKYKTIDVRNLFELLCKRQNNQQFEEFIKLVCSFINLYKSSGYTNSEFERLSNDNRASERNLFLRDRTELFLSIVHPIYDFYQKSIGIEQRIDFNDMINEATRIAQLPEARFDYKYIIIDEYQDISKSRYGLVKAIKDKTGAKVMCVGDDWQSIYRFAGSDLDLFTRFGDYFGIYETMKIERTYRNSQELINIAGKFVMRNKKQMTKDLKSAKSSPQPIKVQAISTNMGDVVHTTIENIVEEYGVESSIMLLGRNNRDIKQLADHRSFIVDVDKRTIKSVKYKGLKLTFMSAHKSKGLEADNVILINGRNALLGFPNRISDDPVLQWVLTTPDTLEFAEERRLFYVALTRTRNELVIVVPENEKSVFVNELINEYKVPYVLTGIEKPISSNPKCLTCKTGTLVERKASNGNLFVGCSNYPGCRRTYSDIRLIKNQVYCATCKGYMVMRKNSRGVPFYGCTNYPHCRTTMNK